MDGYSSLVNILAQQKVRSMSNRAKLKRMNPMWHEANGEIRAFDLAIKLIKQEMDAGRKEES